MLPVPVITHLSLKAGRALRKLKKLGLPTLEHSIAILPDRAILLYPVNSLNSLEWGIKEQYKEKEYFLLEDYKPKEGDVIMDVGANLGLSTLIYSNLAGEDGFVIAIEPVPDIFELLKRNLRLNKVKNVLPLNYALSDRDGEIEFYIPKNVEDCSSFYQDHLILHHFNEFSFSKIKVKTRTFDSLIKTLKDHNNIDILKIDVEGAELSVLHGASNALGDGHVEKLIIEVHKSVNSPERISDYLKSFGYKIDGYFETYEHKGILYSRLER